jgi:hypothetical protein
LRTFAWVLAFKACKHAISEGLHERDHMLGQSLEGNHFVAGGVVDVRLSGQDHAEIRVVAQLGWEVLSGESMMRLPDVSALGAEGNLLAGLHAVTPTSPPDSLSPLTGCQRTGRGLGGREAACAGSLGVQGGGALDGFA